MAICFEWLMIIFVSEWHFSLSFWIHKHQYTVSNCGIFTKNYDIKVNRIGSLWPAYLPMFLQIMFCRIEEDQPFTCPFSHLCHKGVSFSYLKVIKMVLAQSNLGTRKMQHRSWQATLWLPHLSTVITQMFHNQWGNDLLMPKCGT